MKAIIFDIDGTLADGQHREHHVQGERKDWGAYFDKMGDDLPHPHICWLAEFFALHHVDDDYEKVGLFIVSGRPDSHRDQTEEWLNTHVPLLFNRVEAVMMRPAGDHRQDFVVKREILAGIRGQGYDEIICLDDRQQVVDMWRAEGCTCLQVAPGDFDKRREYESGRLILLIGPAGAGKSAYAKSNFREHEIVSTDELRAQLCKGDFKDQSKNDQVFAAMRALVETRLRHGLLTVVDATNIKDRDRKALLAIAPKDCKVEYHIVNRPMSDKERDGGWRNKCLVRDGARHIPLMHKHEAVFKQNLPAILAGDNDPRVVCIDATQFRGTL